MCKRKKYLTVTLLYSDYWLVNASPPILLAVVIEVKFSLSSTHKELAAISLTKSYTGVYTKSLRH